MIEVWAFAMIVSYGPEVAEVRFTGFPDAEACEQFRHEFVDLQVHPDPGLLLKVREVKPCEPVGVSAESAKSEDQ